MYNTSHLITSFHVLHCIIPHQTPSLTLFQTTPQFHITLSFITISHQHLSLAAHYSTLQYHVSNRTISATLCITPHLALHPIFTLLTYHITPHFRPRHTSFMHRTIILHKTLHRISHALHLASFHHSVAVITPTGNSTSHYHVSHSIPHHPSVHHHFLHLATCHISHNTTTTYQSRRITHSLIPHRATFHISCHSARTSPYYTTTFHNPLPV